MALRSCSYRARAFRARSACGRCLFHMKCNGPVHRADNPPRDATLRVASRKEMIDAGQNEPPGSAVREGRALGLLVIQRREKSRPGPSTCASERHVQCRVAENRDHMAHRGDSPRSGSASGIGESRRSAGSGARHGPPHLSRLRGRLRLMARRF